jgi:hypothetical protein
MKQTVTRIYFNLYYKEASEFIYTLTKKLGEENFPFTLKTIMHPDIYVRRDSTVLYLHKNDFADVFQVIKPILQERKIVTSRAIPAFTKKIFEGVGVAEEPIKKLSSESFGLHRSRLIAEGLVMAFKSKCILKENIIEVVIKRLRREGLKLPRLYLNPESKDIYQIN